MRLFHKIGTKIHNVGIELDISFYASDFMMVTKAITPIQVQYSSKNTSGKCVFYCAECDKEIPIEEVVSKCFKCGDLFTAKELMAHKKSGLIFCMTCSEKEKEEFDSTKVFLTFLENYSIK
jgi:hypothetical protein